MFESTGPGGSTGFNQRLQGHHSLLMTSMMVGLQSCLWRMALGELCETSGVDCTLGVKKAQKEENSQKKKRRHSSTPSPSPPHRRRREDRDPDPSESSEEPARRKTPLLIFPTPRSWGRVRPRFLYSKHAS